MLTTCIFCVVVSVGNISLYASCVSLYKGIIHLRNKYKDYKIYIYNK